MKYVDAHTVGYNINFIKNTNIGIRELKLLLMVLLGLKRKEIIIFQSNSKQNSLISCTNYFSIWQKYKIKNISKWKIFFDLFLLSADAKLINTIFYKFTYVKSRYWCKIVVYDLPHLNSLSCVYKLFCYSLFVDVSIWYSH